MHTRTHTNTRIHTYIHAHNLFAGPKANWLDHYHRHVTVIIIGSLKMSLKKVTQEHGI